MRLMLLSAAFALIVPVSARADAPAKGTPDIKSATALAFGPHGILFIGDSQSGTIFAVDTGDSKPGSDKPVNIERVDAKIAGVLGTTEKDVKINDLKVNPASGNVYFAVTRGAGAGTAAIVRITRSDAVEPLVLKDITFSKVDLPNPTQSKNRAAAITNMAFVDGKIVVAGLSNEEFASTLRSIPYPFKSADKGTAIEIFHGAHGRIETQSPIRTFVSYKIGKEENLMAAYQCTPLVKIPVTDLKPGVKVKGTTIAELGMGNTPIDMIVYTKSGKDYILMANSARGVMKIPTDSFESAAAITSKTGIAGAKYETVSELKNVIQLDKLDDACALLLIKTDSGFDLKTVELP